MLLVDLKFRPPWAIMICWTVFVFILNSKKLCVRMRCTKQENGADVVSRATEKPLFRKDEVARWTLPEVHRRVVGGGVNYVDNAVCICRSTTVEIMVMFKNCFYIFFIYLPSYISIFTASLFSSLREILKYGHHLFIDILYWRQRWVFKPRQEPWFGKIIFKPTGRIPKLIMFFPSPNRTIWSQL